MELSKSFKTFAAPETGRKVVQLTDGDSYTYPLYYFIPSFTKDSRYLIYHRALSELGGVQIHRLDLTTGQDVCLSCAKSKKSVWHPWCREKGPGVLDHRSVLNVERNTLIYFDDNDVWEVCIETLAKKLLFSIPKDRTPIGQNCVTTDGKWLVYIHHDYNLFEEMVKLSYQDARDASRNTALAAYNFETGEHRPLLFINSPIHHVLPYDEKHVVFCHPTTENAMLLTSIEGGYYTHMRTQEGDGGAVCHYIATKSGLMYEILGSNTGKVFGGIYNPFTHNKFELSLPKEFGYTHTGCDDEGKLWFYENEKHDGDFCYHDMYYLAKHDEKSGDEWVKLIGHWPTHGGGQNSHFHPRLTPDRKWILFTGGEPSTDKNHMFLLDISDIDQTYGIPTV